MSQPQVIPQFEGVWTVDHATLPGGRVAYTGTLIIQKTDQIYTLTWNITAGHYVGIGITHNGHLYVSCGETFDQLGIALYYRHDDGLSGTWSVPELGGRIGDVVFTNPWTGTFEGRHIVIHGGPHMNEVGLWEVSFEKHNDIYEIMWRQPQGQARKGLGMAMENGIAAGWYPDPKQLAFLDYRFDDQAPHRLAASWALGGFTTLGVEQLTRAGEIPGS